MSSKKKWNSFYPNKHNESPVMYLKMYLMSRNSKKQMIAIDTILSQMKDENANVAEIIINTDIPGLLCDVMNNHNPPLIAKVFSCLLELSRNKSFYEQKHPPVVIETTCRTLRILSKDVGNLKIIHCGIMLLCQTLSGSDKETAVNITQVLSLGKELLFNPLFQRVHLNVMFMLRFVLKIKEFNHKDLLAVLCQMLNLLSKLKKNNITRFQHYITITSEIVLHSLRICILEPNAPLAHKSIERAWSLILSGIVPYIEGLEVKRCHSGFVRRLLTCLLQACTYLGSKRLHRLAHRMAAGGFLTLLPIFSLHFNDKNLHTCIMSLLAQLLTLLANKVLDLSNFEHQLINETLLSLPADCHVWPQLLGQSEASKTHFAIIIYIYFVVLCAKSFEKFPSFFQPLCCYLKCQTSFPSPALLKSLWLLFAVSSLSHMSQTCRGNSKKQLQAADKILVSWLRRTPLTPVYTHHPALLHWGFVSDVTPRLLRINLMTLWLKDKSLPSIEVIETLVLRNKEAAFYLLDVLSCCPDDIIPQTLNTLKAVLSRDKTDEGVGMSMHIWTNLSKSLSLLTSPHPGITVSSICCMIYLACKVVPDKPDLVLLLRVSYQLLKVIRRPMIMMDLSLVQVLHAQLFKLANILVIKTNMAKDYRVVEAFLQDTVLLQALLTSLHSSDKKIVILPALKLLSCLQFYQKMYNIQVKSSRYMSAETLLQLMSSPGAETVFVCLHLFSGLQATAGMQPLIDLPSNTADHLIENLYLDFQMLTLKSDESWKCQSRLLEFCKVHNPVMEQHLLVQPYTYMVIQLALQKNGINSLDIVKFVSLWLAGLQQVGVVPRTNYSRALCQDRLSCTLTEIVKALLKKGHQDSELTDIHFDIMAKIYNLNVNIPTNMMRSLRAKIVKKLF